MQSGAALVECNPQTLQPSRTDYREVLLPRFKARTWSDNGSRRLTATSVPSTSVPLYTLPNPANGWAQVAGTGYKTIIDLQASVAKVHSTPHPWAFRSKAGWC